MNKILIVEDQDNEAKVLRDILVGYGFNIVIAADAIQGTELALRECPDLIILDLQLPAGSGESALENIRKSSRTKFTPVIILTGSDRFAVKQTILEKEADGYLQKPYKPDELMKIVHGFLPIQNTK